jgi:hypothetical protein
MMKRQFGYKIGLLLLWCAWFARLGGAQAVATEPVPHFGTTGSTLFFDHEEWVMIHHTQATFGSGAGLSDVILLRSEIITNSDGFGGPMHDVRVVVVNGGRVIADYGAPMRRSPENNRPGLHVDAYLDLTHITGDGIPDSIPFRLPRRVGFCNVRAYSSLQRIL